MGVEHARRFQFHRADVDPGDRGEVLVPPGDVCEVAQRGQLDAVLPVLPSRLDGAFEEGPGVLPDELLEALGGGLEQHGCRFAAPAIGERRQPRRQQIGPGDPALDGAAVGDQVAHDRPVLIVVNRRQDQLGGPAEVASTPEPFGCAPADRPGLSLVEDPGQRRTPQRVRPEGPVEPALHEGSGRQQTVDVDLADHGGQDLRVGAVDGDEGGEGAPFRRRQPLQHLLPDVPCGHRRARGGRQRHQRGPTAGGREGAGRHLVELGELVELGGREPEIVLPEPDHLVRRGQAGQTQVWLGASGEHQVAVGGQRLEQLGHQPGPARVGGQLVDVVEHDGDLQGRSQQDRVDDGGDASPGVVEREGAGQARRQRGCRRVRRLAREPHVDAARGERVLDQRLREQRRLAEPGRRGDRHYPPVVAVQQQAEKPGAEQHGRPDLRRPAPLRPHAERVGPLSGR
jgi:hypothetical protein